MQRRHAETSYTDSVAFKMVLNRPKDPQIFKTDKTLDLIIKFSVSVGNPSMDPFMVTEELCIHRHAIDSCIYR